MLVSPRRFCQPHSVLRLILGLFFCSAALPLKSDPLPPSDVVPGDAIPAGAFATAWSIQAAGAGALRLMTMAAVAGHYEAAVEIKLSSSAITYWRQPGEAGVPPEFSFAGSENVAKANVSYPAPQRLDEGGIEAFGYRGGVTFPLQVTPADTTKPVHLAVTLNYAICDRICVPAKGHVDLVLPQNGDSPARAAIAAAQASVPIVLSAADSAQHVAISTQKGQAKPQWQLSWLGADPLTDLFAEGPQGFAFATHKTAANIFSLAAVEMPTEPVASVPVRLTLTGPGKSYELTLPLPIDQSAH